MGLISSNFNKTDSKSSFCLLIWIVIWNRDFFIFDSALSMVRNPNNNKIVLDLFPGVNKIQHARLPFPFWYQILIKYWSEFNEIPNPLSNLINRLQQSEIMEKRGDRVGRYHKISPVLIVMESWIHGLMFRTQMRWRITWEFDGNWWISLVKVLVVVVVVYIKWLTWDVFLVEKVGQGQAYGDGEYFEQETKR